MPKPFVSICIPTFNGEEYLNQCLQTCVEQTFTDYEIVICDDCSTDSTIEIVEKYASRYSFIRLIKNEKNLGLVANWNKCLNEAYGQWIKFVFQDDFISPDCLIKFVNAIEEKSIFIVSERNFLLPENSTSDTKDYYQRRVRTLVNTVKSPLNYYPPDLISKIAVRNMSMNFIAEPSLTFFKREVTGTVGFFNSDLKQICDFEFCLRIGSIYGIKYVPEKLCTFRIHEHTTTSKNISTNYFILRYIEPLLLSYQMLYGEIFSSFRKNLNLPETLKLKLYFRVKTYQAFCKNEEERQNHWVFDENNLEYKGVKAVKSGNAFIRLISFLLAK